MRRVAMVALLLGWGCDGGPGFRGCPELPLGGCPMAGGGTCQDGECEALYACVSGGWRLRATCDGAGGSATTSGGQGGACQGVELDKTGQQSGCQPPLQAPDCGVGAAESCAPCVSGCVDFFLCTAEGWQAIAYCSEDGELIVE